MKASRLIAFAIVLIFASLSAQAQSNPPDDFLVPENPAWRRVLGNPIEANFYKADIQTVAKVLSDQGLCSVVVEVSPQRNIPLVTRKLHRVSLRTAIYLVCQDTGLNAGWIYAGRIPQVIRLY